VDGIALITLDNPPVNAMHPTGALRHWPRRVKQAIYVADEVKFLVVLCPLCCESRCSIDVPKYHVGLATPSSAPRAQHQ
jgi:hypothetical protein